MIALLVLAGSCAAAAVALAYAELAGVRGTRASLARVAGYGRRALEEQAESPAGPRIVESLAAVTLRVAPGRDRTKTAERLHAAGFGRLRVEVFLALKAALAAAALALGLLLGVASGGFGSAVALAVCGGGIGFIFPDVLLNLRARSRRERILAELPNGLDLLAVTVEAGLGLDAALQRYADQGEGPLADEIRLLGAELRVGGSRADVFRRLAERVPSPETKSFVRAVAHADQLGVSLGKTLRQQAQDVRTRRQTLAEERANKAPVKMLFPVVLCIFPALFVIVLGPALITLMEAL